MKSAIGILLVILGLLPVFAEQLSLEGKVSIAGPTVREAKFLVEGSEFTVTGTELTAFVQQHSKGDFIVLIEGDFDLNAQTVEANKITLVRAL